MRTRLHRVSREEQLAAGCNVQLLQQVLATKMVKLTESLQAACSGTEDCTSRSACAQTKEVGPCRGNFPRWSDECDGCSDDDDSNYYADTIMLDDQ